MVKVPLVSVVMPVFNEERYILDALKSILNQTYKNLEIIIVNDCSNDSSVSIINSLHDERLYIVHNQTKLGIAESLNKGLAIATGKYIARMDSDDISEPNRIEMQVRYLEENVDVGVCGTGIRFIGEAEGKRMFSCQSELVFVDLLFQCALCHPTVMFRKEILDMYSLKYDPEFEKAEDYRLWCKIALYSKIKNIKETGLNYRIHTKQVSVLYKQMQLDASDKIRASFLADNGVFLLDEEINVYNKACNVDVLTSEEYTLLVKVLRHIILTLNKNERFNTVYLIYTMSGLVDTTFKKVIRDNKKKTEYMKLRLQNKFIKFIVLSRVCKTLIS